MSAGLTHSDNLVAGVAVMRAGDDVAPHHHPQAEIYFGQLVQGDVVIDDVAHDIRPVVSLFIPGSALHGIPKVTESLRNFYAFAADRFDEIDYCFADQPL